MSKFKIGDPIHYYAEEEVGIVNGAYEGLWFSDLHKFISVGGDKCCGELAGMEPGHHPQGKPHWKA